MRRVASAQGRPPFQVTTFTSPGAYFTSSQRKRYSSGPRFRRPWETPFTNSSASSPEE